MNKLQEFIAHARKKGMDHATIRMLLLSAGWKEKDIAEAMTEESLDMPVPVPSDGGGARDAFFHLLSFVSLYTTVISLCILFFQYINHLFPDAALESNPIDDTGMLSTIRWSIAAIIVSVPLFVWITRVLVKEMKKHVEKSVSGIRRWLTYLTLFVTAAALMGDVITLVFYLLEGELSIRFLLKIFIILILAGMVFLYYFISLKLSPNDASEKGLHRNFCIGASALVLIAIVWGIVLAGSPMTERERKFDDRRVQDLQSIQSEISNIAYGVNATAPSVTQPNVPVDPVPATLQDVVTKAVYQKPTIVDPETGVPYEYTVTNSTQYQLCATFSFVRNQTYDIFWNHPAGNHCFAIDVVNPKAH
jgi:hypothetical protein